MADQLAAAVPNTSRKQRSRFLTVPKKVLRILIHKPLGGIGALILLLLVIGGFGAPVLAPYGQSESQLASSYHSPSGENWFGTDNIGRDVFSRVLYGVRLALVVAVGTGLISTVMFLTLGTLSGYYQGTVDLLVQRFVDAMMALPNIVLLITLSMVVGRGIAPVVLILAASSAFTFSRVIRSSVILVREMPYVEAARALGAGDMRILFRHVVPNIIAPAIVLGTLVAGIAILAEATLSFLGFGIPPPAPSLGLMIRQTDLIYAAPWAVLFPGIALSLIIFSIFVLGDMLRDILDPRQRGRGDVVL